MKKPLKIKFVDMYDGFTPQTSRLAKIIEENFGYELSDTPDYLITGPYSHEHLKYDCVKIFYTGENCIPDFNIYDYAIGFDHLQFGDRYLRCPLFAIRSAFKGFRTQQPPSDDELINRKFCSFVVSNGVGDPIRTKFFQELSKYKKVDSGGRYLNNIGGPVEDKMAFVAQYKFAIAFENSAAPGYTTEKIMEPMSVWSVPIYWGDPLVTADFHANTFVSVKIEDDIERAIAEIVRLDSDDEAYLKMCKAQPLVYPELDYYQSKLISFLNGIFEQPIEKARRIIPYGYQATHYRKVYYKALNRYDLCEKPLNFARKVKRAVKTVIGS